MEKVILTKNGQRKEFSPKAAEIAMAVLGWSDLPPVPPELQGKGPILLKRQIEPPEVKAELEIKIEPKVTPSEPIPDAKQPEVIVEKPKVKRLRKK